MCANPASWAWGRAVPRTTAFTLVELLVVVSIVALLLAILLPALGMARQQAGTVRGLANLSQIGRGVLTYAEDFETMLPVGYLDLGSGVDTNWTTLIHGYLKGAAMTNAALNPSSFLELFKDPNAQLPGGRVHYSAHPILMPDLSPLRPIKTTYSSTRLVRPAQVILVMDGAQDPLHQSNAHATAWQLDGGAIWNQWHYRGWDTDNNDPIDPGPNQDARIAAGHIRWRQAGQTANFLYCDGHAGTRSAGVITKASVRVD